MANNTLMQKSTPLGYLTCPRVGLEGELGTEHVVTLDSGITYECAGCGEVFYWEDQTHWERVSDTVDS